MLYTIIFVNMAASSRKDNTEIARLLNPNILMDE
jgi:hypothetical protein